MPLRISATRHVLFSILFLGLTPLVLIYLTYVFGLPNLKTGCDTSIWFLLIMTGVLSAVVVGKCKCKDGDINVFGLRLFTIHAILSMLLALLAVLYSIFSEVFFSQGSAILPIQRAIVEKNKLNIADTGLLTQPKHNIYMLDVSKSMTYQTANTNLKSDYDNLINLISDDPDIKYTPKEGATLKTALDKLKNGADALTRAKLDIIKMLRDKLHTDTSCEYAVFAFSGTSTQLDTLQILNSNNFAKTVSKILQLSELLPNGKENNITDFTSALQYIEKSLHDKDLDKNIGSRFLTHNINVHIFSDLIHDNGKLGDSYSDSCAISDIVDELNRNSIMWILYQNYRRPDNMNSYATKYTVDVQQTIKNITDENSFCTPDGACHFPDFSRFYSRRPIVLLYQNPFFCLDADAKYTFSRFDSDSFLISLISPREEDRRQEFTYSDSRGRRTLKVRRPYYIYDRTEDFSIGFSGHVCSQFPHVELQLSDLRKKTTMFAEVVFQRALHPCVAWVIFIITLLAIYISILIYFFGFGIIKCE